MRPNAAVRDHYNYDEFGVPAPGAKLSEDGRNVNHNTFGYTGELWDEEDDLLYLRSRYYQPETGRFLSRDVFPGYAANPLSMNKYAYVENNPVNYIDPLGFNKKESNPSDEIFSNLDALSTLAGMYTNDKTLANQLVFQFIRHNTYSGGLWNDVAGTIDKKFIEYVSKVNPELDKFFSGTVFFYEPSGGQVDFIHFAAVINALLYDSSSLKSNIVGEANVDNLAGWAGDLQTFIVDVQKATKNSDDYTTVYNSASKLMGKSGTKFSLPDLLADVDAFNVYNDLGSSSISSTLRNYYSSGYKSRYTDFTGGMDKENIRSIVGDYTEEYWIWPKKWPLLKNVNVTDSQSRAIRDAFTDFIWKKVQSE
ncbi:MAG: RHS repeat-associated core domain-containing protein [Eubacteriales bacterium]